MGTEAFLRALEAENARIIVGSVLMPHDGDEIARALTLALVHGVDVALPGEKPREITLDLRRMRAIVGMDDRSRLVHVEGGAPLATLEDSLRGRGLTLVAEPKELCVAEWLAGGAPGSRAHDDDPVDGLVSGVHAVIRDGTRVHVRPVPRRATGPDLVSLIAASGGALAVIASAFLLVKPLEETATIAFSFADDDTAARALAFMRGSGVRPLRSSISGTAVSLTFGASRIGMSVATRIARERGGREVDPRAADFCAEAPPDLFAARLALALSASPREGS